MSDNKVHLIDHGHWKVRCGLEHFTRHTFRVEEADCPVCLRSFVEEAQQQMNQGRDKLARAQRRFLSLGMPWGKTR